MVDTSVLRDGLYFGEGPRCGPDGRLFYSDFYAHEVRAIDIDTGDDELVCTVDGQPSGLGWLPDGRMLVVSMLDRRVLRLEPTGELVEHGDISHIASFHANDMLVDDAGRAYVGNFGFDLHGLIDEVGIPALLDPSYDPPGASLALIRPDGDVVVAAEDLKFPNGTVRIQNAESNILVIAETIAFRLTAFDVADDGTLSNRRVWADVKEHGIAPDGTCADGDGIWVAPALQAAAYRVTEGGKVTHRVETTQPCFAVAVVGDTLVCVTAPDSHPRIAAAERQGKLETYRIESHQA
ncbi:gluconolaconase [Lentzea sp. NBRC 105346]|uniref:SMP-30/gluconolactonase/LRE family protein n=1 Tax=Lentzea sp. NBRC 105346 TaxID=3032205 RepID=UPI0024A2689D|nr:SMP-30/gluconolactonase/LRE family protein [Lentzea sp. NBRC 105346]GLZ34211.1 gluconolaconase [Lentzea sp. NBRC 105346]